MGQGGSRTHLPAFSRGGSPGASVSQANHENCRDHKECRSLCCIRLTEASDPRCMPRKGLLAHCLPPVSASGVGQALRCQGRWVLDGALEVPGS